MRLQAGIATVLTLAAAASARADDAAAEAPAPLPRVTVIAEHESDGYLIERSRTATKTDTPLIDVPQSVAVVARELIRDQSMQSLADVARYVPGAGMAQGEGNRDTIILRGNSSTSDFFLDGVRDDVEYFRDLYSIDRVEILKGPNAMIFGRGGAGGVVNRVTRQANWEAVREVSLQGGSWDNRRATFDFGDAVSDAFAARVMGVYEDSESYRDGVELERKGINPTFALAIGEATLVRFSYEYFDYDRVADRGIPSFEGRPFRTDASTFFGDPEQSPTHATVNMGTITVDHAFSDDLRLRNRTVYADYDKFYQNVYAGNAVTVVDGTGFVPLAAYNNAQLRENFFNQTDLTFSFETGAVGHEFLVGAEIGEQSTDNVRMTGLFNGTDLAYLVPAGKPMVSVPLTFAPTELDNTNQGRATIAAVYAQDQVRLSPQWLAILGLRYDNFDMDFTDRRGEGTEFATSDDLLSPRAGLIYKPVENLSLYASYSMAYVPRSGAQLSSLTLTNEAFDPEEFENFEVGAKWDVSPQLAVTAAVFQLDRKNVLVTDPNDPTVSFLVDGQRTEGVELGVSGQVTEAWSIQGGYAWQDGHTDNAVPLLGGLKLAQLPEHVASLWNRYDFTEAWGAGLGVIYQAEMYAAADNLVTLPSFTRVDAGVFFTPNERWRMQLNVENLLDERYYPNAHNNNNITPGSPLAVRLGVTANF